MDRIAILASGSGSNAENIARYFAGSDAVKVASIITNNKTAMVIERAANLGIPCRVFSRQDFSEGTAVLKSLQDDDITFLVLAGFLQLIPVKIIQEYKGRIINIHPALLPLHGGKGFYGSRVHQSVIESGAIMSGITIHHVNDQYDEGDIIFQAACHVSKEETPDSLAEKIHRLEYAYFPVVIEKMLIQLHHNSHE